MATPYALAAMIIGTTTANTHACLPERFSPKLAHSSRRLPRGVRRTVITSTAVIGAKALSNTLMPACGIATARPIAIEYAITR